MKLNNAIKPIHKSAGIGEEKEFTMAVTAQAFHVMSSTLYSNKIRAIIRELSCNAADAHIVAGNEDTPYLVHLPNMIDRSFKIRDFGTGLSKEQVESVYTQYFNSTKTDTNDQVGCLGLGSKSPFAYSDNFSVVSYYNGKKYVYAAYKNDKGNPSISMISEEDTSEPNGLEIRMAVKNSDFDRFRSEAKNVYKWFTLKPTFEGSSIPHIPKLAKVHKGDGWFVSKSTRKDSYGYIIKNACDGPGALMGNILYSIQEEHLINYLDKSLIDIIQIVRPILEFPVGALEFQPSRENLSYERRTIAAIKKRLEDIKLFLDEEVSSKIKKAKNKWDAYLELTSLLNGNDEISRYGKNLINTGHKFKWNNEDVGATDLKDLGFSDAKYQDYSDFWFEHNWRSQKLTTKYRTRRGTKFNPQEDLILIFVDQNKRTFTSNKFRAWMRAFDDKYAETKFYAFDVDGKDSAFVKKFTESLGAQKDEHYFWWHDMPKKPKVPRVGGGGGGGIKRSQSKLLRLRASDRWTAASNLFENYEEVDLESGSGFYIERYKNEALYLGTPGEVFWHLFPAFNKVCDPKDKVEKVYSFTPAQMKKKGKDWVCIYDHLKNVSIDFTEEMQWVLYVHYNIDRDLEKSRSLLLEILSINEAEILKRGKNKEDWENVKEGMELEPSKLGLDAHQIHQFFRDWDRYKGNKNMTVDLKKLSAPKGAGKLKRSVDRLKSKFALVDYIMQKEYYVADLADLKSKKSAIWKYVELSILEEEGLVKKV